VDNVRFSIIIPVSDADTYLEQSIDHCLNLNYPDYEIILLPDKPIPEPSSFRVIPTVNPSPSVKRNVGIQNAQGEICAFIDADAYPTQDWLEKADQHFNDPQVAAVGGPNLTPDEDTEMQKAAGFILAFPLGGGTPKRFSPAPLHECDELQSVNMLIRKSVLEEIGGFDSGLWPGEDAKLSYQIKKMKMKMIYSPEIIVYHHRRPLFRQFLKQLWNYGITKPLAIKRHMSFRHLFYVIPTLFLLGLITGPILFQWLPSLRIVYFSILGFYVAGLLWSTRRPPTVKMKAATFTGIFLMHITYGFAFLIGLFRKGSTIEDNDNLSPSRQYGESAINFSK